jgi:hypothetical protein
LRHIRQIGEGKFSGCCRCSRLWYGGLPSNSATMGSAQHVGWLCAKKLPKPAWLAFQRIYMKAPSAGVSQTRSLCASMHVAQSV